MNDIVYFSSGSKDKGSPRKHLKHCIVCYKKKGLLFYCTTGDFILMDSDYWERRREKEAKEKEKEERW